MFLNNPFPTQLLLYCPGPGQVEPGVPSVLLKVNGYPFLGHVLANVKRNEITDVILICGEGGDRIERAFGDGDRYGMRLRYLHDPDDELGTGGAIRVLEKLLAPAFYTLHGGRYLLMDLESLGTGFVESGLPFVMAVWENDDALAPSDCLVGRDELGRAVVTRYHPDRRQGMRHTAYGACAFRDDVIDLLPPGYSTLEGLHQRNALKRRLGAYLVDRRFYSVDTRHELRTLRDALLNGAAPTYVHLL